MNTLNFAFFSCNLVIILFIYQNFFLSVVTSGSGLNVRMFVWSIHCPTREYSGGYG